MLEEILTSHLQKIVESNVEDMEMSRSIIDSIVILVGVLVQYREISDKFVAVSADEDNSCKSIATVDGSKLSFPALTKLVIEKSKLRFNATRPCHTSRDS